MINRCKCCGDIAPDYSEYCDTCSYIEFNDGFNTPIQMVDDNDDFYYKRYDDDSDSIIQL